MKPVQVLNLILEKIKQNKVAICTQHEWKGFSGENELLFENKNSTLKVNFDIVVFCLGGASWPVTGSDGKWTDHFLKKGISILPFAASNCAFEVKWDPTFIHKMAGKALKNITITCGDQYLAGEIVLTKFGIEGSGIYPLSPVLREQLHKHSFATISIDLKPSLEETTIVERLNEEKNKNITEQLKMRLNFNPLQIQLLKHQLSKEEFTHPQTLANRIKHFKVKITGTGPIEDAISTTGGISLSEINENFKLSKLKGVYAIGEMLDFDAPTGGYLLQSCFSMGHYLANHLNSLPIL